MTIEIRLPIKCSTIKLFYKIINAFIFSIIDIMPLIGFIEIIYYLINYNNVLNWLYEFNVWGLSKVSEHYPFPEIDLISCICIPIFLIYCYNNFPHFKCIKD